MYVHVRSVTQLCPIVCHPMDCIQVPMKYCFSQHCSLLSMPDTATTVCCFVFDSASSFLLELFLCSSSVAYQAATNLKNSSFSVISLPFHTIHGVLKTLMLKWFAILLTSGLHFVRNLYHGPSFLGSCTHHGS